MRIIFFGTPEIAVPSLERLIEGPFDVVGVVSQPDRGRGRGRKRSPSPVAARAADAGVDLLRPENVGEDATAEALARAKPDLGVVVAFGQFIPKRIRTLPRLGYLINGHASLLPRYRGAAPVAHAILDGERYTGVSVMRVERTMDAGPVALARRHRDPARRAAFGCPPGGAEDSFPTEVPCFRSSRDSRPSFSGLGLLQKPDVGARAR